MYIAFSLYTNICFEKYFNVFLFPSAIHAMKQYRNKFSWFKHIFFLRVLLKLIGSRKIASWISYLTAPHKSQEGYHIFSCRYRAFTLCAEKNFIVSFDYYYMTIISLYCFIKNNRLSYLINKTNNNFDLSRSLYFYFLFQ